MNFLLAFLQEAIPSAWISRLRMLDHSLTSRSQSVALYSSAIPVSAIAVA